MNAVSVQLTLAKDQLKQVREMLTAERSTKEKTTANLNSQLDAARRKIGILKADYDNEYCEPSPTSLGPGGYLMDCA